LTTSRPQRFIAISCLALAAPLALAGCGGSSSSSTPPATNPTTPTSQSTAPSVSSSGNGATFDGDFKGTLSMNLCTSAASGNIGSVKATVDGDSASNYLGSVSATELGFVGPGGGDYVSPPGTKIQVSNGGNTFNVEGVKLEDETLTHKAITVHGSLTCP
jgi:hypothetical protein